MTPSLPRPIHPVPESARRASALALAVALLASGCGSAVFGSGTARFSNDEEALFQGCSFSEEEGRSIWECASGTSVLEYRELTPAPTHEAACALIAAANADRGTSSVDDVDDLSFDDVKLSTSAVSYKSDPAAEQPSAASVVATGDLDGGKGLVLACTISTPNPISTVVDTVVCGQRMKAIWKVARLPR